MPEGVCPGLDEELGAAFALDSMGWSMRGSGGFPREVALMCAAPALSCLAAGTLKGTSWPSFGFMRSVGVEGRDGGFLGTCKKTNIIACLP